MWTVLQKFWNDENFFLRVLAVLFAGAAYGFSSGTIPTGVDGLGPVVGAVSNALAIGIATGKWEFGNKKQ